MVDTWLVETDLNEEWDFYTRANIGEVFPDPVAPLSFFYFQHEGGLGGSEMGFRNAYYRIGVMTPDELPDDQCVFLGVTGGYGYLNASALRMLGHRAPDMTAEGHRRRRSSATRRAFRSSSSSPASTVPS